MKSITITLALTCALAAPLAAQKPRPAADRALLPVAPAAPRDTTARADTATRRDTATAAAPKSRRATPSLAGTPPAVQPDSGARSVVAPPSAVPAAPVAPPAPPAPAAPAAAVVQPQAAQPVPPPPPANAFSAGLALPAYAPNAPAMEYGRTLAQLLDSTIVTLVELFRNTSGQPLSGATGPDALSQREKDRWGRCRNLYWDLTTYRDGLTGVTPAVAGHPAVARAAAALDSAIVLALADTSAIAECDNVSSMIAAPGRWTPWEGQYQAAARRFYGGWYAALRTVHEKDRALVLALNTALAADRRLPVPAALQRNPPYAGAGPR